MSMMNTDSVVSLKEHAGPVTIEVTGDTDTAFFPKSAVTKGENVLIKATQVEEIIFGSFKLRLQLKEPGLSSFFYLNARNVKTIKDMNSNLLWTNPSLIPSN